MAHCCTGNLTPVNIHTYLSPYVQAGAHTYIVHALYNKPSMWVPVLLVLKMLCVCVCLCVCVLIHLPVCVCPRVHCSVWEQSITKWARELKVFVHRTLNEVPLCSERWHNPIPLSNCLLLFVFIFKAATALGMRARVIDEKYPTLKRPRLFCCDCVDRGRGLRITRSKWKENVEKRACHARMHWPLNSAGCCATSNAPWSPVCSASRSLRTGRWNNFPGWWQ